MDLRANFLGCWSTNSFVSDGALLPRNILTFFLGNLTANLFFNLPILFLCHSFTHVRSFSSTFPQIRQSIYYHIVYDTECHRSLQHFFHKQCEGRISELLSIQSLEYYYTLHHTQSDIQT